MLLSTPWLGLFAAAVLAGASGEERTTYRPLLPLAPDEGVFAYARISRDGRYLSYASERSAGGRLTRTVNFVDLRSKKVLFSEPGMDSYWAPDGRRIIFLSHYRGEGADVSIWDRDTGKLVREVAPPNLGAYYTWASKDGRDLILTQANRYFFIADGLAERPYREVRSCPGIGTGEQPMMSRDGRLIATFVDGTVVVRGLEDCEPIVETHMTGGKADFSWDNRYIAFHTPKTGASGYRIVVVDLQSREVIPVTSLEGSSLYPSWTADGGLAFRYDSDQYRGFMMAEGFLQNLRQPLPPGKAAVAEATRLGDLAAADHLPSDHVVLVNFWAPWCVHCRDELPRLGQLRQKLRSAHAGAEIVGVCEPGAPAEDRDLILRKLGLSLPQVDVAAEVLPRFAVQMFPTSLLFVDGRLVGRRYGVQSYDDFAAWLRSVGVRIS